jgi:hypothetical protein
VVGEATSGEERVGGGGGKRAIALHAGGRQTLNV